MTPELNQHPATSVEEPTFQTQLNHPVANTQELSKIPQSTSQTLAPEVKEPDALKAFARALMVSLTWSMAGLTNYK